MSRVPTDDPDLGSRWPARHLRRRPQQRTVRRLVRHRRSEAEAVHRKNLETIRSNAAGKATLLDIANRRVRLTARHDVCVRQFDLWPPRWTSSGVRGPHRGPRPGRRGDGGQRARAGEVTYASEPAQHSPGVGAGSVACFPTTHSPPALDERQRWAMNGETPWVPLQPTVATFSWKTGRR